MATNTTTKPKKPLLNLHSNLAITLFFIVVFTVPALLLLHTPSVYISATDHRPWSGDLRLAEFAWNKLDLESPGPRVTLRIAVFSRKWPTAANPGGMERHAYTLHTALSRRGHRVHVFTSPTAGRASTPDTQQQRAQSSPVVHWHEGEPDKWRYNKAWEQFVEENRREPFDVIHSESVALPFFLARGLPNLVVSWHGIALESVQSSIYQDLARKPDEPMSPAFNASLQGMIPKVLNEIRFFPSYAHHVAISDSCGEMLRDVYQIPTGRVHVIINGVDKQGPDVYLIVAGSGPWQNRYKELGPQVIVTGSMGPDGLKGFYNAIDVFVNPTLRPQGLDLTLMEAMMSGKPVMASRFPSIKGTILVKDEFGFMFAPNVGSLGEALAAAVAEGAGRLAERGKACREYASSMFTAWKMALAYERLFLCIKNETFCMYHSS
ncbi:UDP-Glycosyltransferase superfamily protein [Striga hermonthica]|uniref:UDP-Glycosyltransferase superfamily protein n=1 Tax=Striga hermonthica TaxID=68872 RepID=A0A9N7NXE8_STRHE|nr:UDP-Glycosyltransferase superfamily protein [Striga hermonthica]